MNVNNVGVNANCIGMVVYTAMFEGILEVSDIWSHSISTFVRPTVKSSDIRPGLTLLETTELTEDY